MCGGKQPCGNIRVDQLHLSGSVWIPCVEITTRKVEKRRNMIKREVSQTKNRRDNELIKKRLEKIRKDKIRKDEIRKAREIRMTTPPFDLTCAPR